MTTKSFTLSRRGMLGAGASLAVGALVKGTAFAATPDPVFDSHAHLISPDTVRYPQVPADAPGSAASFPPQEFRQFGTERPLPEAGAMTKSRLPRITRSAVRASLAPR